MVQTRKKKSKRGRPRKTKNTGGKRLNSGRKKKNIFNPEETTSEKTIHRRAKQIAEENGYNVKLLEMACNIAKKRSVVDDTLSYIEEPDIENQVHHNEISALAFYLEYNYSAYQYRGLIGDCKSRNCSIYPSYNVIDNAKQKCHVYIEKLTEREVYVSIQNLLDKTSEKLCNSVGLDWSDEALRKLELSVSLGFDSSSGHLNPHQHTDNPADDFSSSQTSLFVTSINILQIASHDHERDNCLWINPTPQSYRFTRPLRMCMEKETDEAIQKEMERIEEEIKYLNAYRFKLSNKKTVRVKYFIYKTMFDGKCLNSLVGNTASSRCPMCLRSSHQFGDVDGDFTPTEQSLSFGLGLLHCKLKVFEHLLHLAYRKPFQQWDIRKGLQDRFKEKKMEVQKEIFTKIGVKVDLVLQGHGTTNTGNVARRCLSDPKLFAECLGLNSQLVTDLANVLILFESKEQLNLDEVEKFCLETYKLHYFLYPWSRMNPTTHKLLMHGCDIARKFPLPISFFSEDCLESGHKYNRKNMKERARQSSRKNRLLDVFNRALYSSDPQLSLEYIQNRMKFNQSNETPEEIDKYFNSSTTDEEDEFNMSVETEE